MPPVRDTAGPSQNGGTDDALKGYRTGPVSGKVIDRVLLWLSLLGDILDDESATFHLRKTLRGMNGVAEIDNEICAPLPEGATQFVQKRRRKRTGREFRLDAQVNGYDIKSVMFNVGSDVNILPKKYWEALGCPCLVYSPIQLRKANQYRIFPIGRFKNVEVYLGGVKTYTGFEVIEIMGGTDPYPALLGIDWAYENYGVIDLKNRTMTFEADGMKVTQPLDPLQGQW